MKVAVVGGTGVLGAPVAKALAARGDEVLALSREPQPGLAEAASHRRINLTTGEGIADALAGVEAVVNAANAGPRNAAPVLVEGTQRLLRAEAAAGVRHHVDVSIVGCDRVPTRYYGVKVAQEKAVAAGDVPWSLLRATQFHSLLAWAFESAARWRLSPRGSARLQPVDPTVVAERLAEAVHAAPGGRIPDVAGPEVLTLSELARTWSAAKRRTLVPLPIPMVGRTGRPLREAALCNPAAASGGPTFEQWLAGE
ncbi:MAG TPA: NAD(P)H-binding protein [Solirubrobacterales bacterium]|nr:NAD(P)H-binding protein [Solirubrobacterales bacterium]